MTQQATENEGTAPPRLSNAKLNLAIEVAMAVKGISAAEIARQAGIPVPVMSTLRAHGKATNGVQLRLLDWLDMRPSYFRADDAQADRPAHPEAA